DPNGESVGGYILGLGEILLGGTIMVSGFALEVVSFGGFTFGLGVTTSSGAALMSLGLATTAYHAQDISFSKYSPTCSSSPSAPVGSSMYGPDQLLIDRGLLPRTPKVGSVDPSLPVNPDDLLKQPEWQEVTHPEAGKKGHRTFENKQTGEQYRHDQGRPGQPGHEARDHYHHLKPNGKGDFNYVDGNGKIVPKGSDPSHIYPKPLK
ncbi:MAG: hypothetical protein Q8L98_00005, partial [Chlamydiales bacterium]|nr:hypothetical protein [Chlamydiales bacterium]